MRRLVYLPVLALLLICIAWSVLWKVTASNVEAGIDQWFADERVAGRIWSCKDRSLGGYPFRIEFRCAAPSFTTEAGGVAASGSVGDILAMANAYRPSLIVAKAQAPLHFQRGGLQVDVSWDDLEVSHRSKNGAFDNAASVLVAPVVRIAENGPAIEFFRAERLEVYARPRPAGGGLELATRVRQARVPLADRVTGETAPIDLIGRASADSEGLLRPAALPVRLEAWRRAGGSLDIAEFKIGKGPAEVEATGRLALDAAHRPQGRLSLKASGIEPLLQRLGIPTAAVAIGSVLSSLLGKGAGQPEAAPAGQISLPVTISDGRVSVGPVRTPITLLPLY